MNKCGDCKRLVTAEGKPYYCAIKDLYTLKEADDACEEYVEDGEPKNANKQAAIRR